MLGGRTDDEVRRRGLRAADFRANAAVGRLQAGVGQVGPIAPYGGIEAVAAPGVYRVVDMFHPLHIRAEARLAAQVEGHVHAQAGVFRCGVHQVPKWRTTAQAEIAAFA
ncbi:hypothetical protein D3C85_1460710 [compost metagenome]